MKNADMKVIAIILSLALVFTLVTSNAVSIASVIMLMSDEPAAAAPAEGTDNSADNSADVSGDEYYGDTYDDGTGDASTGDVAGTGDTATGDAATGDAAGTGDAATGDAAGTGDAATGDAAGTGDAATGNATGNAGTATDNKKPAASTGALKAGQETYNFYKKACLAIKNNAVAGFTRKEWQEVKELNLGNDALKDLLAGFMTSEADAEEKVNAKGSDDAKNRMAPCGAPFSKIKSATCTVSGDNYIIKIVMKDDNTPKKGSNGVAAMSTGILYMEDVKNTIETDGAVKLLVKGLNKGVINYKAYTITAKMTKDGKFIDLSHYTEGFIEADVKLVIGSISGDGVLAFNSHWYSFKY